MLKVVFIAAKSFIRLLEVKIFFVFKLGTIRYTLFSTNRNVYELEIELKMVGKKWTEF